MDNILDNYIKLTIDADNALGGRLCKVEYGGTSYYKSLNVYGDVSFYLPPLPVAYRGNANIYIGTSAASQSSWETQTDNRGAYLSRTVCLGSGDNLTVYFSMSHDYRPADREDLYTNIPTASNSAKGAVIVPTGNSYGLQMNGSHLELKTASNTQKGGIYVGNGLSINNGILNLKTATKRTSSGTQDYECRGGVYVKEYASGGSYTGNGLGIYSDGEIYIKKGNGLKVDSTGQLTLKPAKYISVRCSVTPTTISSGSTEFITASIPSDSPLRDGYCIPYDFYVGYDSGGFLAVFDVYIGSGFYELTPPYTKISAYAKNNSNASKTINWLQVSCMQYIY